MSEQEFIYRRSGKVRWLFLLSLILGLTLDSLIVSLQSSPLFPVFSLLITFYWAGHFLDRSYIATAFIMGLLIDTLYQTSLGAHALIFVSLIFLLSRHRLLFRSYRTTQQAIFIAGYFYLYQGLNWLFFSPVLPEHEWLAYWLMPIFSSLLWIVLTPILNIFTKHAEQS